MQRSQRENRFHFYLTQLQDDQSAWSDISNMVKATHTYRRARKAAFTAALLWDGTVLMLIATTVIYTSLARSSLPGWISILFVGCSVANFVNIVSTLMRWITRRILFVALRTKLVYETV
jgi:hypothetical protein